MKGWYYPKVRIKRADCWSIVLDLGRKPNGAGRIQKAITFYGTEKEAEQKLRSLLTDADRGELVLPGRLTLGVHLDNWVADVKLTHRFTTYLSYENAVRTHLKPRLGSILLQQLRPSDVERALRAATPGGRPIQKNVLKLALDQAVRDELVRINVMSRLKKARRGPRPAPKRMNAWTVDEAQAMLSAAAAADAQTSALLGLALDSGARKAELQGLRWTDIDLAKKTMNIEWQLVKNGTPPVFGPTKTGKVHTVDLSSETIARLREQKRTQAELKMTMRQEYTDYGLVFAHAGRARGPALGSPLGSASFRSTLDRLADQTGICRITVHGLRHTSATLLLAAGVMPHVVQARLGHSSIVTTMQIYAHCLPSQQSDAASRLGELLYGGKL